MPAERSAEERARALLREHLTPEQWREYELTMTVRLRAPSGRLYRIGRNTYSGRLIEGEVSGPLMFPRGLCIYPENRELPFADVVLALVLLVQNDEERFREVANHDGTLYAPVVAAPTRKPRRWRSAIRHLVWVPILVMLVALLGIALGSPLVVALAQSVQFATMVAIVMMTAGESYRCARAGMRDLARTGWALVFMSVLGAIALGVLAAGAWAKV